jgi:protein-S-isoprenylcysteine O-methyltransferase Ste14
MPKLHMGKRPQEHHYNLAGEHRHSHAVQATIACLFFVAWITDTVSGYSTILNQYIPVGIRISLGIVLLVPSAYLAISGLYVVFGKKRAELVVIRDGVFHVVRHPIYLSEILLYAGFLMFSISLTALVIFIIGIGLLHYISRYEEKLLIARFGKDYERYMKEVPMWIPFVRRRKTR